MLSTGKALAETLVFTAIPDQDETRLQERFSKVADYLEKTLEVDVRFVPVKDYAATVSAFRNNQVQLAWFGGLSGVQARRLVDGSEAIAQGVEDTQFKTYFIAHKSAAIEPGEDFPKDMAGKTFTFGSKGSTSGRLMPEFYIREETGQAPDKFFSRVGFSDNHSRTIALVESGAYQLGAVSFDVWETELAAGDIDLDAVKVVWETPTYPDYQWTIRGDVDKTFGEGFKKKVQQALLSMDDPDLLASFPRKKFIKAENKDYQQILNVAKDIGLID
ncbi:putative selenate ABC transporter substrate-binding protein [Allohahella marinimesophila]